jgi:hypothetical protein
MAAEEELVHPNLPEGHMGRAGLSDEHRAKLAASKKGPALPPLTPNTSMNSYAVSLIRTYTPVLVGLVLAFLTTHFGIHPDAGTAAGLTAVLAAIFTGIYYAGVRALEKKYPKAGVLLGHTAKPLYVKAAKAPK